MTDKEKIEQITRLLNELCIANCFTLAEFNKTFPKTTIAELKSELWEMYCFASDVSNTIKEGK